MAMLFFSMVGLCGAVLFFLFARRNLRHSRFMRYIGILGIGTASSLVPFGPYGLVMGFPSVFLASILVSLLLDHD